MPRRTATTLLLFTLVAGLIGCDHATKHMAQTHLRGQAPTALIQHVLDLTYTENRAIAFSLLHSVPETIRLPLILVSAAAGLGLCGLLWWRRRAAPLPEHLAYALILAGGVGNLSDRALRGYVVDFIHLHHWPVFNIADVCLVVGMGLLFWISLRAPKAEPARP